jgi:type VI secretion system protein ImpI
MALTLTIENETNLPDGGPLSVTASGKRGLDIGRDTHLDWTLPDPTRFISGKHCEVRFKDGNYWLYDVSTNGTFLHGTEGRLKGPHQLRDGERLVIGQYIIAVRIDGEGAAQAPKGLSGPPPASSYEELWSPTEDAAPPVPRSMVQGPRDAPAPVKPDFLDWAVDVPHTFDPPPPPRAPASPPPITTAPAPPVFAPPPAPPPAAPTFAPAPAASAPPADFAPPMPASSKPAEEFDWARSTPLPPPVVEAPPAVPNPRRPVWVSTEPAGPWSGAADPASATPAAVPAAPTGLPPAPSLNAFEPLPPATATPGAHPAPAVAPAPAAPANAVAPAPIAFGGGQFVRRLAHGAGVPEQSFDRQDPEQLAEQLGASMRLVVENLRQLLSARVEAKRLARSANQTMIQALDNNPLKFSPTGEEALRIMFGPPTRSYLDAGRALQQGFDDIKTHHMQTYAAMQQALRMLVADLDPQVIDDETEQERGIAAMVGSRKARLWDAYMNRWQAKTRKQEGGMVDVFMQYFAECYDRNDKKLR